MNWTGFLKANRKIDEAAGRVAEQMKLTLDRSDALELLTEIELLLKRNDKILETAKSNQGVIRDTLKKIRKVL